MIRYLIQYMDYDFVEYEEMINFIKRNEIVVTKDTFDKSESLEYDEKLEPLAFNLVVSDYGLDWLQHETIVLKHPIKNIYKVVQK